MGAHFVAKKMKHKVSPSYTTSLSFIRSYHSTFKYLKIPSQKFPNEMAIYS